VKYDSESKDSFSLHLPIHRLHHLQELFLGERLFLYKQPDERFLQH
jgi:hypothetical protein